jgi:RNA polymerase sigma factor (sigma-70 family)
MIVQLDDGRGWSCCRVADVCGNFRHQACRDKKCDIGDQPGGTTEYANMRLNHVPRLMSLPPQRAARQEGGQPSSAASPDEWGRLMVAAQNGHGGAYQRLLGEASEWLERYFRRRLPHGDVEDAVQETLLAIHRRRHTYDGKYPFGPWLAAIARRKWIDQLRLLGRRPTEELSDALAIDDHEATVTSASVLASLLKELRPIQAQVISLVKLRGYSVEEVSRETGLSPSAVKMNIHRGLARLTALIEKTNNVE